MLKWACCKMLCHFERPREIRSYFTLFHVKSTDFSVASSLEMTGSCILQQVLFLLAKKAVWQSVSLVPSALLSPCPASGGPIFFASWPKKMGEKKGRFPLRKLSRQPLYRSSRCLRFWYPGRIWLLFYPRARAGLGPSGVRCSIGFHPTAYEGKTRCRYVRISDAQRSCRGFRRLGCFIFIFMRDSAKICRQGVDKSGAWR